MNRPTNARTNATTNFRPPTYIIVLIVVFALAMAARLNDVVTRVGAQGTDTPPVQTTTDALQGEAAREAAQQPLSAASDAVTAAQADAPPPQDPPPFASSTDSERANAVAESRGLPAQPSRAYSASEVEVLQSLAKRRDELEGREAVLREREAMLSAAEAEIDRKTKELDTLRASLEQLVGAQEAKEKEQLSKLVRTFENMKPKEAAEIFNSMDMDVLIPIIDAMNERKSAPILAAMNPATARTVTTRLAAKRKLPASAADAPVTSAPAPAAAPAAPPPAQLSLPPSDAADQTITP